MSQLSIPLESGHVYHIWTHANGSENLFRRDDNYRYFLEKYFKYIKPFADTLAYCLMPNHLHLMIRVLPEDRFNLPDFKNLEGFIGTGSSGYSRYLGRQFSNLFNAYSKAYNKVFQRKGSLFMHTFKRKQIDSDNGTMALVIYIHTNPIHHGFTRNLNDWPHCSWRDYLKGDNPQVNTSDIIDLFGNKEMFIKMHKENCRDILQKVFSKK